MTERGYVLHNKDKFSKIRIERNSACASCGKCGMTEKQKHIDFYVENTCDAKEGDCVELNIPDVNTLPLAFVAYILPIVPAIVLMLISVFLNWKEWVTLLLFFGGLTVGVVIIAVVDKLHKHRWAQSPTMVAVVNIGGDNSKEEPSVVSEEASNSVSNEDTQNEDK